MRRSKERTEAVPHYSAWGRSLVIPALLSLLATGCVETDAEQAERPVNLPQEIDRSTIDAESSGSSLASDSEGSSADSTWVVVEGEASPFHDATSTSPPEKLVSLVDSAQEIPILESRLSEETPNRVWLLVNSEHARLIDSVSSRIRWRLVLGKNKFWLVQVRGFYLRNGTEFRPHLVGKSAGKDVGAHVLGHHVSAIPPYLGHVAAGQTHRGHGPGGPSRVPMPAIHPWRPGPPSINHPIAAPSMGGLGAVGHASGSGRGKK